MPQRLVTFGEIMLRLKSPGFERLFQTPRLEVTFGGAEANVAVSLANFGLPVSFVTVLPPNPVGDACLADLRRLGVDPTWISRRGERLGVYYVEEGANYRPSQVVYDRVGSAIAMAEPGCLDWNAIFEGADWFHISGITPAISPTAAALSLEAVQAAHDLGLTVSCDFNYRQNLWRYGRPAREVMGELLKWVDIGIASEGDCQEVLGIPIEQAQGPDSWAAYENLGKAVLAAFPGLKMQAITRHQGSGVDRFEWSACLHDREGFYCSRAYTITDFIERVGGGDAFSAGLVYGLFTGRGSQGALEFAVAAAALKHSIPGDYNRVTVAEVERLLSGSAHGRILR